MRNGTHFAVTVALMAAVIFFAHYIATWLNGHPLAGGSGAALTLAGIVARRIWEWRTGE